MTAIADALIHAPVPKSRGYWASVAVRLSRDPVAMVALAVVLAIVLAAVVAPLIAPADPLKGSMIRRL
ncbi:MAG: peptide/nickel transport system permease protein, partial [Alphaproteobacteria bacterium]|nr:peptide/nickel transport system permease protein [Alphaproteobacteria bacterium]